MRVENIVPTRAFDGTGGVLWRPELCFASYVARHGALPGTVDDLIGSLPYPEARPTEGWVLGEGVFTPAAGPPTRTLYLERPRETGEYAWVPADQLPYLSPEEGFEPRLGLTATTERRLLYAQVPGDSEVPGLENGWLFSRLSDFEPNMGTPSTEEQYLTLPAAKTMENVQLGAFLSLLREAMILGISRQESGEELPLPRLELLDSMFGPRNPTAWINPYSGAPMRSVPLDEAAPGDFTELQYGDGLVLLVHYRDIEGGVSSCAVGVRGDQSGGDFPPRS